MGERVARNKDGMTYYIPANMKYENWQKSFLEGDKSDLQEINPDDTMKKKLEVKELNKLKQSGMTETEYQEYLNIISNHNKQVWGISACIRHPELHVSKVH